MSQLLVELCTILIEEKLGERIASLWQHTADVGRSTFKGLLDSSGLGQQELANHLTVLLQHRCLRYFTDKEFDQAYYTVDYNGAYHLLRLSRMVDIVRKRCGADAAKIVSNVAQFGQITVRDLTQLYEVHEPTKVDHLHDHLLALLRAGFLMRAWPTFSQDPYDLQQELEKKVIAEEFNGKRVTGPVSSLKLQEAVNQRKRKQHQIENDNEEFASYEHYGSAYSNKRRKLDVRNGHSAHGRATSLLKDDMILYLNTKKYLTSLRSECLERHATSELGTSAAAIYGSLLRTLESQVIDLKQSVNRVTINYDSDEDEEGVAAAPTTTIDQPRTTALEMLAELPSNIEYTNSMRVNPEAVPKKSGRDQKALAKSLVDDNDNFDDIMHIKTEETEEDDDYMEITERAKVFDMINAHLDLLAEHSFRYCTKTSSRNPPEWQVDFPALSEKLLLTEIDNTVRARFGNESARLVRLLRAKGKLEEKQISILAYMPVKELRARLTTLFANGFVDAQEIPKDNQRAPNRALYLWYFDLTKLRSAMLQRCYHAMCRAFQRMAFERQKYANVVQKMQDTVRDRLADRRAKIIPADEEDTTQPYANGTAKHDESDMLTNGDTSNNGGLFVNNSLSSETLAGDTGRGENRSSLSHGGEAPDKKRKHATNDGGLFDDDLDTPPRLRDAHKATIRAQSKFVIAPAGLMKDFSDNSLEKQRYRQWRQLEGVFLGQILKLDDLVVLLRDF